MHPRTDIRRAAGPPGAGRRGFTVVQVLLAIAFLVLLVGSLIRPFAEHRAAARDARRLEHLATIQAAIERYQAAHGTYPAPNQEPGFGGWDASCNGDFLDELVRAGELAEVPRDPLDDEAHHYRYYVYSRASYGCGSGGPFYVLGLTRFESERFERDRRRGFACSMRDWGAEFDFVAVGGATPAESPQ